MSRPSWAVWRSIGVSRLIEVAVATSLALAFDVAGLDEVGQDSLRGSERDPDVVGDIAQPNLGVAGDAEQDLRVVGDELPARTGLLA